ncbi:RING-type E3 ubiquitin transferase [Ranunculus cassubicifolius]
MQRRRRLRRVALPNSQALSLLGRDLREAHLQVLLGGSGYRSSSTTNAATSAATDSFLSSLVMNFPSSEVDEISKSAVLGVEDTSIKSVAPKPIWKTSFDPSLSTEEREQKMKQATMRAGFVQDLVLSTLFSD